MTDDRRHSLDVFDLHAGGDVSRVVFGGLAVPPGDSVKDMARFLAEQADGLRRLLLSAPRGDPSMSVNLLVPPRDPEARAGHVIMEAMGYPDFSGSNTICTATALIEGGAAPVTDGTSGFVLEAPAGPTRVTVDCRGGRAVGVTYEAGPAFIVERGLCVSVPGQGPVFFDLVWSGVLYAVVNAPAQGFRLISEELPALRAFARAFIGQARPAVNVTHPEMEPCGELSFVLFSGPLQHTADGGRRQRTAVYVHPEVICGSPTGTATSAQIALLAADRALHAGQSLQTVSPAGTSFLGTLLENVRVDSGEGVRTTVTGRAYGLARLKVMIDPSDPTFEDAGLSRLLPPGPSG